MLILGQFRLSKGYVCPAGLGNIRILGLGPSGLKPHAEGLEIERKKTLSPHILNNPRSRQVSLPATLYCEVHLSQNFKGLSAILIVYLEH